MSIADLNSLTILVIDDEPFIRKLIGRMLSQLGVKDVIEAEDGADGLEQIRQSRKNIDLVICDMQMPNIDGFEFVRQLRAAKHLPHPDMPVLILTGHSDADNLHDAVNLGIQGFLTKPVSKINLEKRITSALTSPTIDP